MGSITQYVTQNLRLWSAHIKRYCPSHNYQYIYTQQSGLRTHSTHAPETILCLPKFKGKIKSLATHLSLTRPPLLSMFSLITQTQIYAPITFHESLTHNLLTRKITHNGR